MKKFQKNSKTRILLSLIITLNSYTTNDYIFPNDESVGLSCITIDF